MDIMLGNDEVQLRDRQAYFLHPLPPPTPCKIPFKNSTDHSYAFPYTTIA